MVKDIYRPAVVQVKHLINPDVHSNILLFVLADSEGFRVSTVYVWSPCNSIITKSFLTCTSNLVDYCIGL